MTPRNSSTRYGAVAQSLHWGTVVLVLLAWFLGSFGDAVPRGPARMAVLFVHIAAGLAVMLLLALRLLWRAGDPAPKALSTAMGMWGDRAAAIVHWALYVLLLAVPVAGIVLQFARGNSLPVFGLFEIASPWVTDRGFARSMKEIHEVLANLMLALAGLHGGAALFHHLVLRDATLARMTPWLRSPEA